MWIAPHKFLVQHFVFLNLEVIINPVQASSIPQDCHLNSDLELPPSLMHTRCGPVMENNSTISVTILKTVTQDLPFETWILCSITGWEPSVWVFSLLLATFGWGYSVMLLVDATAILYSVSNVAGGCHCHSLLLLVNVPLPLFAWEIA